MLYRVATPSEFSAFYKFIERKWGQQHGWSRPKVSYVLANYEQLKLSALAALVRSHAEDREMQMVLLPGQDVNGLFQELRAVWRQYQGVKDNIKRALMDARKRAGASGARSGGLS